MKPSVAPLVVSLLAFGVALACLWKVASAPDSAAADAARDDAEARQSHRCAELAAKVDELTARVTTLEQTTVTPANVAGEPLEAERTELPIAADESIVEENAAATTPERGTTREKLRQLNATKDAAEKLRLARELAASETVFEQLAGVRALAQLAPAEAAPIAERMLAEMRDGKRQSWQVADVAHALEQAGDAHVLDGYVEAEKAKLASSEAPQRVRAVYELGLARSEKVVPVVVGSLADTSSEVRLAALEALRASGDEKSVAAVEPLLNDPVAAVRDRAVRTLETLERRGEGAAPRSTSLRDDLQRRLRRRGGR